MGLSDFDAELLASYRRSWRERDFIFGSTADYRATGEVDVRLDAAASTCTPGSSKRC